MAAAEVRINKNEEDALVEEATYIPIGLQGMLLRVRQAIYITLIRQVCKEKPIVYRDKQAPRVACRPALSAADA